jgi:hypothetical protein
MSKEICKGHTRQKSYPYHASPCINKEWKDGFCKLHHPDEKRRRQKERDNIKDQKYLKSKQQP